MRTFLLAPLAALAFATLVPAGPSAAQEASGPAGSWTFDQETPRGTMTHTVTFALEDDAWVGTLSNERKSFDLEDVTFEDGTVSFTFEAGPPPGRQGQGPQGQRRTGQGEEDGRAAPSRSFEGVLDGDEVRGEMSGPRGATQVVLTRTES